MTDFNRELGPRLHAAIEANEELRARNTMKSIGMAAAMADALRRRGVSEAAAQVSAELGVLAFGIGYRRWADPAGNDAPGELVTHLRRLRRTPLGYRRPPLKKRDRPAGTDFSRLPAFERYGGVLQEWPYGFTSSSDPTADRGSGQCP